MHCLGGLRTADLAQPVDHVVTERIDGVELGGLRDPLVGEVGQDPLLDLVDGDAERDPRLVGGGVIGLEVHGVAGLEPTEVVIEFGHDHSRADLVAVRLGGQRIDGFTVLGALDVDRHQIGGGRRALDGDELPVLAAQSVDLIGNVVVGSVRTGHRNGQALVAGEIDLGSNLDDRVEGHVAVVFASGHVELGLRDRIDIVFAHGLEVELGHGLLHCLGPGVARLDPRLEDLSRNLALPEAGMLTSLAICFQAASIAGSNSSDSIVTEILTLLPSRGSMEDFTGRGAYPPMGICHASPPGNVVGAVGDPRYGVDSALRGRRVRDVAQSG